MNVLAQIQRLRIKQKGIDRHTETVTRSIDHLRSTLVTRQRAESQQYWNRLRDNRLFREQTRRLPGEAYIQQQHTEQLIAQIESVESDFETTQQSIEQLREYDLPAYRRWLREYDPGAYRDEFRPKRSRPDQVTLPDLTNPTEQQLMVKAQQVMGDHYQPPAVKLFDYGD